MKKYDTQLGAEKPLRLQMRACGDQTREMGQTDDDKTQMLLTLELTCGGNDKSQKVHLLQDGRVQPDPKDRTGKAHWMPNPKKEEQEEFNRATAPYCVPL